MTPCISIHNLCVSYGSQSVLNGLSVDFPAGHLSVILGENGCGKSTLLNAVSRIVPFSSGEIFLADKPLSSFSARDLALSLSLVCQNTQPLPISVYDYLLLGRTPHRSLFSISDSDEDKSIVDNTINRLGLSHYQHKPLSNLSGGERQLAAVARAIVQDTPVMLLDEPTANLDIRHQELILKTLKNEVATNNRSVIVVMHDINLASRYADYVCLLQNGSIHTAGSTHEVLNAENLSSLYNTPIKQIPGSLLFFPA